MSVSSSYFWLLCRTTATYWQNIKYSQEIITNGFKSCKKWWSHTLKLGLEFIETTTFACIALQSIVKRNKKWKFLDEYVQLVQKDSVAVWRYEWKEILKRLWQGQKSGRSWSLAKELPCHLQGCISCHWICTRWWIEVASVEALKDQLKHLFSKVTPSLSVIEDKSVVQKIYRCCESVKRFIMNKMTA